MPTPSILIFPPRWPRSSRCSAQRRKRFAKELDINGRQWGLRLSESIEFQFRRRYNLTPQDPRFLELTPEEIVLDTWAHAHVDDPKLREEDYNPSFEQDLAEMGENLPDIPPDPGDLETVFDDVFG